MSPLPSLAQSLQGRDLGHLRIVAEFWGVEFSAPDAKVGLQRLIPLLLQKDQVVEVINSLPEGAHKALADIQRNAGRITWALFTKRYGSVREIGAARRDRELPYQYPISPAEVLWYRGLVGRAFFDADPGPEEFAYIPADLLELLPRILRQGIKPLGRPATTIERTFTLTANDHILDHACTLMAGLRAGVSDDDLNQALASPSVASPPFHLNAHILRIILDDSGLIGADGTPSPEPTRAFLEAPRSEALAQLYWGWRGSTHFDELRNLPGVQAEGEWQNNPLRTRQMVLNFLDTVPLKTWWNMPSFISAIRQVQPDYQRPAGDYDSWYLRDIRSGEYLRGFEHWNEVDGYLLCYLLGGPLYWLGILDLAQPEMNAPCTAFRTSEWAFDLLRGEVPILATREDQLVQVSSEARLRVPRLAPRAVRYQIARFCAWEGLADDIYSYRITPPSLDRARQQGLRPGQLMAIIRKFAAVVPPSLGRALDRWEEHGAEARLERVVVLRMSDPELLQILRNSRAAGFLGDPLGPTTVVIKAGAVKKVLAILAELGYLGEADLEGEP